MANEGQCQQSVLVMVVGDDVARDKDGSSVQLAARSTSWHFLWRFIVADNTMWLNVNHRLPTLYFIHQSVNVNNRYVL